MPCPNILLKAPSNASNASQMESNACQPKHIIINSNSALATALMQVQQLSSVIPTIPNNTQTLTSESIPPELIEPAPESANNPEDIKLNKQQLWCEWNA